MAMMMATPPRLPMSHFHICPNQLRFVLEPLPPLGSARDDGGGVVCRSALSSVAGVLAAWWWRPHRV
jgi:hypothetical protein